MNTTGVARGGSIVVMACSIVGMALNAAPAAAPTHIPDSDAVVEYDGTLIPGVTDSGQIGWVDPLDEYDWYCMELIEGATTTITVDTLSGDILPNCGVAEGVVSEGQLFGDLGLTIAATGNPSDPSVTLEFVAPFSGPVTVWVSTWLGEAGGEYAVLMEGGESSDACGSIVPVEDADWSVLKEMFRN